MAKIHITLVGGQTTPVYQGIVQANPDRVILIHSQQTEAEAIRIQEEMEVDCELREFDPVDLKQINAAIVKLKSKISANEELSINLSGGTKAWSLLMYDSFKNEANTRIFVIDQNNLVWNLKTYESTEVQFDLDVQFRLLGNELKDYRRLEDYTESDKELIKKIRELRQFNFQDFNAVTEKLSHFPNETTATGKGKSVLHWNSAERWFEFSMHNRQGLALQRRLQSEHVRDLVLNTGWFELEIALLLAGWDKAKQLGMNCVFKAKGGTPKNEIDIIVHAGNKLLFVECKTQIKNETDIDKFASAVKVYGGLGSKALFVTDALMSDKAQEKCADHGIMTFCLQQNTFNLPVESLLFKMLDSELFNINSK